MKKEGRLGRNEWSDSENENWKDDTDEIMRPFLIENHYHIPKKEDIKDKIKIRREKRKNDGKDAKYKRFTNKN